MYQLGFIEVLDRKNTNADCNSCLKKCWEPQCEREPAEGQHSRGQLPETSTLLQGWLCWMIDLQNVDLHNINIQNLTIGVRSNVSWYSQRSGSWPCTSWPSKVRPFFIDSVNRALLQLHTIDLFWHWSRQSPFAWNRSVGSSNYKLLAQQEIILVKSYIRLATMWGWMQSCHL